MESGAGGGGRRSGRDTKATELGFGWLQERGPQRQGRPPRRGRVGRTEPDPPCGIHRQTGAGRWWRRPRPSARLERRGRAGGSGEERGRKGEKPGREIGSRCIYSVGCLRSKSRTTAKGSTKKRRSRPRIRSRQNPFQATVAIGWKIRRTRELRATWPPWLAAKVPRFDNKRLYSRMTIIERHVLASDLLAPARPIRTLLA